LEGNDYMGLRRPAGVIHDIFVVAEHRRKSVGATRLRATIDALRPRGETQIVLSTAYKDEAGKKLFALAGFQPTMVEMTRQLNGAGS
jgi:GNAT superfamily N-acetyltransferase